jgi:RNA polymerase sigma-70 factor, ECF subfamily
MEKTGLQTNHTRDPIRGSHESAIQELTQIIACRKQSFHLIAMQKLGNVADAEDAVQDALLSAFQHLDQFQGRAQMSTWLTRIVINSSVMKIRQRSRHSHFSLDQVSAESDQTLADTIPDNVSGPEEARRERELAELLSQLARKLSPVLRRTLELRVVAGMSIRQAADLLELGEGTVKARSSRARANLKRMMQA